MSFFLNPVTDEYGTTYVPTMAGYTALVLLILVLLILVNAIFSKGKHLKAKTVAFSAMGIALATVLSFVKLFPMPFGGEVTLCSLLVISLIGYWFGLGPGIASSIACGLLQIIISPYIISLPQMILDYVLAYGALGLSGLFHKKTGKYSLLCAYLTAIIGKLFFAWLSGVVFFAYCAGDAGYNSVALYSFVYNGSYLGAEALISVAVISLPVVRKAIMQLKEQS